MVVQSWSVVHHQPFAAGGRWIRNPV